MSDSSKRTDRLDSWKAIAEYLQRTERTGRRWEQELGLPVRRVPGARGHSVFAFKSEIDDWLTTSRRSVADLREQPAETRTWNPWIPAAALVIAAALGWYTVRPRASESLSRIELTPAAVIASDGDVTRWTYAFPAGERVSVPQERQRDPGDVFADQDPAVVVATSLRVRTADETVRSGELLWFTPRGILQRSLSLDDRLRYGRNEYGEPWGITDFRVFGSPSTRRLAVAAHHYRWWPSIVALVDDRAQRRGTFVNAGWLERVHWLSRDRLLVAGFSESQDGGMVGILDAHAVNGQSPETPGSQFFCTTCGPDRPLRYVVMPRSEVNRVSGSRFNRARLELAEGRIVVRTIEVPLGEIEGIDAIYEFTPNLELVHSRFSDRYWEMHAVLEGRGQIHHTRENCPDRDGPRGVRVWELGTGWRTVASGAP